MPFPLSCATKIGALTRHRSAQLDFHEEPETFRISYEATISEKEQEFRYSAAITGKSDGSLSFPEKGRLLSDFLTNRTGFVVLHPIEGVAGAACRIEHVDGTTEEHAVSLFNRSRPTNDRLASDHARVFARIEVSPAAWKATLSKWKISATGRTLLTKPMCAPWLCLGHT